jgi:predicted Zn-ribbon and HTH transcriptional regulator
MAYLYLISRSGRTSSISAAVVVVASSVALYLYRLKRIRADMRRTLADAFLGERPPFCFNCGYDLRASDATRCPECGTSLGEPH